VQDKAKSSTDTVIMARQIFIRLSFTKFILFKLIAKASPILPCL
jgi:hypothetical protein